MPKSRHNTTAAKFQSDLEKGQKGERDIIPFLESKGLTFVGDSICIYPERFKFFDLVFQTKDRQEVKVEVKTDFYINDRFDTKNIVIEVSCKKKPSGISVSQSDLFVTYFPNLSESKRWGW